MLNIDGISNRIRNAGFVAEVERECVQMAQGARAEYLDEMPSLSVHAPRGHFLSSDLERSPWRKFAIRSANGIRDPYA